MIQRYRSAQNYSYGITELQQEKPKLETHGMPLAPSVSHSRRWIPVEEILAVKSFASCCDSAGKPNLSGKIKTTKSHFLTLSCFCLSGVNYSKIHSVHDWLLAGADLM